MTDLLVAHYYAAAQHATRDVAYASMMSNIKKTTSYLAANLRFLMKIRGWNQKELERRAGVSQKTISNALNGVYQTKIETAEALGRAFGLNGWLMISPFLIQNVESGGSIAKLLESYMLASEEGQQLVLQIAEREATYGIKK